MTRIEKMNRKLHCHCRYSCCCCFAAAGQSSTTALRHSCELPLPTFATPTIGWLLHCFLLLAIVITCCTLLCDCRCSCHWPIYRQSSTAALRQYRHRPLSAFAAPVVGWLLHRCLPPAFVILHCRAIANARVAALPPSPLPPPSSLATITVVFVATAAVAAASAVSDVVVANTITVITAVVVALATCRCCVAASAAATTTAIFLLPLLVDCCCRCRCRRHRHHRRLHHCRRCHSRIFCCRF